MKSSSYKLDLGFKYPENISAAEEIFQKLESLSVLERSIPELKDFRDDMIHIFLKSVEGNLNCIRAIFNLQNINISKVEQEPKDLEQIRRE